ncbi:hypothetical protein GYMLUDRAFT_262222 [Collybiopsis luxurians FD-317 M1]|uniref:Protein kinase domain-containing protein n=1 Tax=Collybiopsis luxurians FD-317 M1 TaxID=944289 RepID=A0A0D0C9J0_9AGAR|nr:hypothetical protein GYMLUDRAFT_262222 [Collybiopsis luxurians FD-317 M1]
MVKKLRRFPRELLEVFPNLQPPLPQNSEQLKLRGKRNGKEREISPNEALQGYCFTFDYLNGLQKGKRTVVLRKLLSRSDVLIGQGPIVVEVGCDCQDQGCNWKGENGRCDWDGLDLVMKISFPAAGRVPEDEIIRDLLNLAVDQHSWALNHLPKLLCSFTVRFGDDSIQKRLKMELGDEIYEERVIRGSIQEKIFHIEQVKSDFEEAQVVYDAFQCHEWVHDVGRILHRDISMSNVMFRRIEGEVYGVLNDFDLATSIDDLDRTPTSKHRTGTRPFMAHEQHDVDWNGPPRYRHDAESFFYLILILGCDYSNPGTKLDNPPFQLWYNGGDEYLAAKKHSLLSNGKFLPPTKRTGYLQWLTEIQSCLFWGFQALNQVHHKALREKARKPVRLEGANNDELTVEAFDQATLGENFTADKIRQVFRRFDNRVVITRNPAREYLNIQS